MASAAETSVAGEAAPLSAYELQRLDNIARNQKVLESLGLVRRDAELHESIRSKEAPKKKRKVPARGGGTTCHGYRRLDPTIASGG